LAPQALQADIRADAQHFPFVAAAGMGLAQAHNIMHLQVWEHGGIISWGVDALPGGIPQVRWCFTILIEADSYCVLRIAYWVLRKLAHEIRNTE